MKRFASYANNGELIQAVHDLGHVNGLVLDATFGMGTWWRNAEGLTRVTGRVGMDINRTKAAWAMRGGVTGPGGPMCADFRRPPFKRGSFQTIFYDPRYKLNGTPTLDAGGPDERYGADAVKPWQQIQAELLDGLGHVRADGDVAVTDGLAPLLAPNGRLLAKCMDQVSSGRMRWQTFELMKRAEQVGLELVDLLEYEIHPRPQPEGRRQLHAEANYSTLLIFGRPPIRLRPLS